MPQQRNYIKLHAAAFIFAKITRAASEIADMLGITDKTVRRYTDDPQWNNALDELGYTGERSFTSAKKRDAKRDTPEKYKQAYDLYLQLRKENTPQHKIASRVSEESDLPASTVRRWARLGNWIE